MREVNMENVTYGYKQVNEKKEIDYEKWIDLSGLPRKDNKISWKESVGYTIKFNYNSILGELIIDECLENNYMIIKYKSYKFRTKGSRLKQCIIGDIVTRDMKVGQVLKNDIRDITIIKKESRKDNKNRTFKWYEYKCNICGRKHWCRQQGIVIGKGCISCYKEKENILNTAPWMVKYFAHPEDAKRYTPNSNQKASMRCPDCGKVKEKRISDLYYTRSLGCICGDGFSYPEKLMYTILTQLNIEFKAQLNKSDFGWCENYRYDFYIPSLNCIIETHGEQHYINKSSKWVSLSEQKNIDSIKKNIALKNGILHYIEIDCRNTNLNWIKNEIIKSQLVNLVELDNIDWIMCNKFATSNLVREVSEYWDNKKHNETSRNLCDYFKLSKSTIINYLKRGTELGWCTYDPKEETKKIVSNNGKLGGKKVKMFDSDGNLLGIFESCSELSRQSEELFGVKLLSSKISTVANGKRNHHKGYTFKYIEENQNIAC